MEITENNVLYPAAKLIEELQSNIPIVDPPWLMAVHKMLVCGLFAAQLKIPYVFGGTYAKNKSFDCSALMQEMYAYIGVKIPRVSRDQAKAGVGVPFEEAREGDLVFFDTNNDGIINHVGMHAGAGNMLHTNTPSKPIRIQSIESYGSRVVAVRRFL